MSIRPTTRYGRTPSNIGTRSTRETVTPELWGDIDDYVSGEEIEETLTYDVQGYLSNNHLSDLASGETYGYEG